MPERLVDLYLSSHRKLTRTVENDTKTGQKNMRVTRLGEIDRGFKTRVVFLEKEVVEKKRSSNFIVIGLACYPSRRNIFTGSRNGVIVGSSRS